MYRLKQLLENSAFTIGITLLILLNAITMGLETSASIVAQYGTALHVLDRLFLVCFTLELAAKMLVYRLGFYRSGWNWFDLIIVGIAWLPAAGALTVLRALRILRVMRLLSVVPQMRRVVAALAHSIPGMLSIISVLLLIFYVAAVLATRLFGTSDNASMQEWFGSIGESAYTLFQIMTLESWSMGIVRPTMELFPLAWLFFVPFIVITSFAVLNLFIGIIVDAMQSTHSIKSDDAEEQLRLTLHRLIQQNTAIDARLKQLESKLDYLTQNNLHRQ